MDQPIFSHVYDNGLVLVAEPMMSLESAAFTFLVPAGCVYDPPARLGLATLTCEMAPAAPASATAASSSRTWKTWASSGANRSPTATPATAAPRWPGTCSPGSSCSPTCCGARCFPTTSSSGPRRRRCKSCGRRGRAGPEGDARAAAPALSRPVGPLQPRPDRRARGNRHRRDSRLLHAPLSAQRHDPGRGRPFRLGAAEGPRRHAAGRLGAATRSRSRRPANRFPSGPHLDHESNQTQIGIAYQSVPYRDPDYFQAWGAVGVLSGGMSSRLFTEVREKRGLCYTVYATIHTLRDRGACCAMPAPAPNGPRKRST